MLGTVADKEVVKKEYDMKELIEMGKDKKCVCGFSDSNRAIYEHHIGNCRDVGTDMWEAMSQY